jgi:hypothetical protein
LDDEARETICSLCTFFVKPGALTKRSQQLVLMQFSPSWKMTTILTFPSRSCPWSSSEREVLDQIRRVFSDRGLETDCEHGITDEGDPWMACHETADGAFVAHIARIGVAYLLVWADGTSVRAASLNRFAEVARRGTVHAA